MPRAASMVNPTAAAMRSEAGGRGWDCGASMNMDATIITANTSATMLPSIATIALAVTPTGLCMEIIYFLAPRRRITLRV